MAVVGGQRWQGRQRCKVVVNGEKKNKTVATMKAAQKK